MPRFSSAPGAFLDPNTWAANASAEAALFGLRMLAPNAASLLASEPVPPLPNFPATPGKIPSTSDPRIGGAIGEAANIGMSLLPFPAAGLSAGAGRSILGLLRRAAPEAPQTAQSLASRGVFMYNPPVKLPRPFSADYPSGTPADATGRLTADIEGRPLTARWVVGRKVVGGEDISFSTSELDALTEAGTGKPSTLDSARALKGNAGATLLNRVSGRPLEVQLDRNLPPDKAVLVHAHENAHVIDQLAGQIPTKGLSEELKGIYNTLNNPNRGYPDRSEAATWGKKFTPEALGYKGAQIPREYIVEAIRAYMVDPNYLKTVAPKTAAAIREAVNSHPILSKIIQFNTLGGLAAMNGIDAAATAIPKQQPPVLSQ